ncbi:MAG: glycosyltransferase family 4 protein [Acidobacteriota bacterium]
MKPLSFCFVTTFYPPHHFGGDALFVERLASALVSDGHQVQVIYDSDAFFLAGDEPRATGDPEADRRIQVHDLGRGAVGRTDLFLSHQLGRPVLKRSEIRRLLRQDDFDVIHFHNISLLGGPAVLREGHGVKLCTLHDYWFVCSMHTLWRYGREACRARTCIRCTLKGGRPVQWWRYTGSVRRNEEAIDAFITGSAFSRTAHMENGFGQDIEVIPHFVPLVRPEGVVASAVTEARPFVLYAGRLEQLKGIEDLIRFFRSYRELDLVIAGTGTMDAQLRRDAAGLDHIRFAGWKDGASLRELYRRSLAVVVPSLCYETFGLSAAEAFANGSPAILRDIGALTELAAGGGALLYSTDEELRAHLDTLRLDSQARAKLAEEARKSYETHFTPRVHLTKYYALIERLQESKTA